ncbi:hypothetical protein BJ508DRAFT_412104 [Ascobolus immersus RN42]|uniref:Helix-turn-helix domain-containing protein n=1 Tax=Ascobolus immersus RN42 TaxID=1160509 RepID=A0A3N4IHJ9_ASCIM|nr:hypothetical protein BJ508DRAFT_412104 [Ascobolus immersus RN42]
MGSASSKAASKAAPRTFAAGAQKAQQTARPSVSKPAATTQPTPPSGATADTTKSSAILNDARDPDFASMLNQVGHVGQARFAPKEKPYNAATSIMSKRGEISAAFKQEAEEKEFGGKQGQSWLDALAVKKVLELKKDGWSNDRIEKHLQLRPGVVARLGEFIRA